MILNIWKLFMYEMFTTTERQFIPQNKFNRTLLSLLEVFTRRDLKQCCSVILNLPSNYVKQALQIFNIDLLFETPALWGWREQDNLVVLDVFYKHWRRDFLSVSRIYRLHYDTEIGNNLSLKNKTLVVWTLSRHYS